MLTLSEGHGELAADMNETTRRELTEELPLFGPDRLARMLGVLGDLTAELRVSTNPRLAFEIALTRLVRPDSDLTLEALAERVEALEQGYSARAAVRGAVAAAGAPVAAPVADAQGAPAQLAPAQEAPAREAAAVAAAAPVAEAPVPEAAAQPTVAVEAAPVVQEAAAPAPQAAPGAQAGAPVTAAEETSAPEPAQAAEAIEPAASAQPAAGGPLPEKLCADLQNPATLQRVWQQIMTTLKNKAAAHGVLFLGTKAVFDSAASMLTIEFPAENEFAFATASKANVQEELAEAIQHVCGAPLAFTLAKAGAPAPGQGSAAAQAAAQPAAAAQAAAQPAADPAPDRGPEPAPMAAQAAPAAQPEAAPEPTPEAAPEPQLDASTGASPQLTPEGGVPYDEVPIDAYDDVAPWEDGPLADPVPAAGLAGEALATATMEGAAPAAQVTGSEGAAPAADEPDIDGALAAAFGEGTFFTEVTE